MARHVWSVLCRRPITDTTSNSLSLIDTVEELSLIGPPSRSEQLEGPQGVAVSYVLVSLWSRDDPDVPEVVHTRMRIVDGNGHVAAELERNIELLKFKRIRFQIDVEALPVTGPGTVEFVVQRRETSNTGKHRWITEASVPVDIDITEADDPPDE